MSDNGKPSKIKKMVVIFVVLIAISAILAVWMSQSIRDDFNSLNCNDKGVYITEFWGRSGKTDLVVELIDYFNQDCKSSGKFFVEPVEDKGFGLMFIPAGEMEDGVEYEINIINNKPETNDGYVVDKEFRIEIGR